MSDLVKEALYFASIKHQGQFRKYTKAPYLVHPVAVADLVRQYGGTDIMVAAAYLHDVVEDCGVELSTIQKLFGNSVYIHVFYLTKISNHQHGNREVRTVIDVEHVSHAPNDTKTIKIADIYCNVSDMIREDPGYAVKYAKEKLLFLEVLKEGNKELWDRTKKLIDDFLNSYCGVNFVKVV